MDRLHIPSAQRLAFALVALVALWASACVSDADYADTDDALSGPVVFADFCDRYAELVCDANARCCDQPVLGSYEACVARRPCPAAVTDPLVVSGVIAYDPDAAGAYLRDLRSATDACAHNATAPELPFLASTRQAGESCNDTAIPSISPSSACAEGLECAFTDEGLFCVPSAYPDRPALGESCDPERDTCAEGFCDAGSSRCEPARTEGAPCTGHDQCLGHLCLPSSGHIAGPTDAQCDAPGCVCTAPAIARYCHADVASMVEPPPRPPRDINLGAPTRLCALADAAQAGSGTQDPVALAYFFRPDAREPNGRYYTCDITSGLVPGEWACCDLPDADRDGLSDAVIKPAPTPRDVIYSKAYHNGPDPAAITSIRIVDSIGRDVEMHTFDVGLSHASCAHCKRTDTSCDLCWTGADRCDTTVYHWDTIGVVDCDTSGIY